MATVTAVPAANCTPQPSRPKPTTSRRDGSGTGRHPAAPYGSKSTYFLAMASYSPLARMALMAALSRSLVARYSERTLGHPPVADIVAPSCALRRATQGAS